MRRAIPPLLQYVFMAWCLVRHKDIFTFTFILTCAPPDDHKFNELSM